MFCPRLQNSSAYVQELYAITATVQKWRHYLPEKQFTIETDQKVYVNYEPSGLDIGPTLVPLKLLGYDYIISHKPGKSNTAADELSRQEYANYFLFYILSTPYFEFLTRSFSQK